MSLRIVGLFLASAPESDRRDLLSELEVMKTDVGCGMWDGCGMCY